MTLFDLAASTAAKDRGMALAADAKRELLAEAKGIARQLARAHESSECTADDVGMYYHALGINIAERLGPAMGSLFKGREWEFTGKRVLSKRKSNHARELKVWRLL